MTSNAEGLRESNVASVLQQGEQLSNILRESIIKIMKVDYCVFAVRRTFCLVTFLRKMLDMSGPTLGQ